MSSYSVRVTSAIQDPLFWLVVIIGYLIISVGTQVVGVPAWLTYFLTIGLAGLLIVWFPFEMREKNRGEIDE